MCDGAIRFQHKEAFSFQFKVFCKCLSDWIIHGTLRETVFLGFDYGTLEEGKALETLNVADVATKSAGSC